MRESERDGERRERRERVREKERTREKVRERRTLEEEGGGGPGAISAVESLRRGGEYEPGPK